MVLTVVTWVVNHAKIKLHGVTSAFNSLNSLEASVFPEFCMLRNIHLYTGHVSYLSVLKAHNTVYQP